MNTETLQKIGFTKGEIKVYFALLELGESTIGPISKRSGVTMSKTYPLLDKLQNKGLTTYIIKNGTKHFQAFNPKRILNLIEEKKKELEKEKKEIEKIIPTLISKQKKEAENSATVYESFEGIKTLYNEILEYLKRSKEDFIGFTLGDEYENEQANLFFKNYDVKRKELGIKVKLIGTKEQKEFFRKRYKPSKNIQIKFVDKSIPTGVVIYGNDVATILWEENPIAFVIKSKRNAKAYKDFFNDIWKIAKK